jgi:hypothetical protein
MKKEGMKRKIPQKLRPIKSKLNALKNRDKIATNRNTKPTAKVSIAASYFFFV